MAEQQAPAQLLAESVMAEQQAVWMFAVQSAPQRVRPD